METLDNFIKELEVKTDMEISDFMNVRPPSERDAIKAILDSKIIKNLQELSGTIKESNVKTERYNNTLTKLTWLIAIFTVVMTIATIISLFKG